VSERLDGIGAPTLVVAGERDWPDFHAVADRIAARIPGARKEMISGAGHLVGMESPRRFTEFLAGFPDMPSARGTVPGPSRCE
jgi:pimeloyl-ACP methyl ester carboxylesterase